MFSSCSLSRLQLSKQQPLSQQSSNQQSSTSGAGHALAERVMCVPKPPGTDELAKLTPRQRGRRGYTFSRPVWNPMAAHEVPALVQRLIQQPEEKTVFSDVRGVYADLKVGEYCLRLQALAWSEATLPDTLPDILPDSELSLLLLLRPMKNSYLPIGSELIVTENSLLHSGQNLQWSDNPTCLYTQVFGDWEAQFSVQVLLPNALPLALPPLTFTRSQVDSL